MRLHLPNTTSTPEPTGYNPFTGELEPLPVGPDYAPPYRHADVHEQAAQAAWEADKHAVSEADYWEWIAKPAPIRAALEAKYGVSGPTTLPTITDEQLADPAYRLSVSKFRLYGREDRDRYVASGRINPAMGRF